MAVSVMPMLVDPGNTTSGNPTASQFNRSPRYVDLEDVQYMRMNVGCQVTDNAGDATYTISYAIQYSLDSTDGIGGTWANLIPPCEPVGTTWTNRFTGWELIDPAASAAGAVWIRVQYIQSRTGGATSAQYIEIQFR
jgi:hypothetical protein